MLRLGSADDGPFAAVGAALQQRSTVGFDCESLPAPQGACVPAGQQPCPAAPTEQASTGMATPKRLNQIAKMAVSRRITCSALPRSSPVDAGSQRKFTGQFRSRATINFSTRRSDPPVKPNPIPASISVLPIG